MISHYYGWKGKQVRNKDGRTGIIKSVDGFGPVLTLSISVNNGVDAEVILKSYTSDCGEKGWEWLCLNLDGVDQWLILGDHN